MRSSGAGRQADAPDHAHLTLTEPAAPTSNTAASCWPTWTRPRRIVGRARRRHRPPDRLGAGRVRAQARGAACAGLRAAHPEVRISFNLTDQVVDLVREGYDLGIRIGGVIDPSFVAVRWPEPARGVRHAGLLRALRHPAHAGRPGAHNCLAFNLQGGQQRGWYFQKDGKPVTVKVDGNSIATTANCCTAGPARDWAWPGARRGRSRRSWRRVN
jgi:DNA-binding transcriptional LysR family regulator